MFRQRRGINFLRAEQQFVLHVMLFSTRNMFFNFTLVLSEVCVQCPVWLIFVVRLRACPVCCAGIVSMILDVYSCPVITIITLLPHSTGAEFLL
jgi:hypothetical protein